MLYHMQLTCAVAYPGCGVCTITILSLLLQGAEGKRVEHGFLGLLVEKMGVWGRWGVNQVHMKRFRPSWGRPSQPPACEQTTRRICPQHAHICTTSLGEHTGY